MNIYIYIHTLHYITLHYITLHYITYIHSYTIFKTIICIYIYMLAPPRSTFEAACNEFEPVYLKANALRRGTNLPDICILFTHCALQNAFRFVNKMQWSCRDMRFF